MNTNRALRRFSVRFGAVVGAYACLLASALADNYNPVPGVLPAGGPLIPPVHLVTGKEYADHFDKDELAVLDPDQVLAWDGFGGTRNGFDYSMSRAAYNTPVMFEGQVDALAAPADALFAEVIGDNAALLFTVDDPAAGIYNGGFVFAEPIAAAGGAGSTQIWAMPHQVDAFLPRSVDGLEVWGEHVIDDAMRYSLHGDDFVTDPAGSRKVAVWAYDGIATSAPFHYTEGPSEAIALLLGDIGLKAQYDELLEVDAIMCYGEELLFSVAPITVQGSAGNIVVLDGGEIFVWDGVQGTAARYLRHGGHLWDTAFDVVGTFGPNGLGYPVFTENVSSIEAVGVVPEPGALALGLGALAAVALLARRRR